MRLNRTCEYHWIDNFISGMKNFPSILCAIFWLQSFGLLNHLICLCNRALCLFEQKSSDIAVSSGDEDSKRGFISALLMPASQELLCVTADQQFFLYCPEESEGGLNLVLRKRFIGYNEEIVDMKFLGDEEQFLAVSTSVEQVSSAMLP